MGEIPTGQNNISFIWSYSRTGYFRDIPIVKLICRFPWLSSYSTLFSKIFFSYNKQDELLFNKKKCTKEKKTEIIKNIIYPDGYTLLTKKETNIRSAPKTFRNLEKSPKGNRFGNTEYSKRELNPNTNHWCGGWKLRDNFVKSWLIRSSYDSGHLNMNHIAQQ